MIYEFVFHALRDVLVAYAGVVVGVTLLLAAAWWSERGTDDSSSVEVRRADRR